MSEQGFMQRRDEESSLADSDLHTDGGETAGASDVAADAARVDGDAGPGALDPRADDSVPIGMDDIGVDTRRTGEDIETV